MILPHRSTRLILFTRIIGLWLVLMAPQLAYSAHFYSYYDPASDAEESTLDALTHALPGGFKASAGASTAFTYTDNVRSSDTQRQSDIGNTSEARLVVASDWERHALEAGVAGAFTRFRDERGEDSHHLKLWMNGRADIGEAMQLLTGIAQREETEARDDPIAPAGLSERRDFGITSGHVGFQYDGILLVSGKGEWGSTSFSNADGIDFSYEDHDDSRYQLRLAYPLSDDLALFVQPAFSEQSYDRPDPSGLTRDSTATELLGGVTYRFSDITQMEIGAGRIHRDFDDARLSDATDTAVHGVLSWQGIEDLRVRAYLDRTLRATTLAGVNDIVVTSGGVSLSYNVDEDWQVSALGGYDHYDFSGSARTDNAYTLGLGAAYRFNTWLESRLDYRYRTRDSSATGFDFDSNTILLSLGFAL